MRPPASTASNIRRRAFVIGVKAERTTEGAADALKHRAKKRSAPREGPSRSIIALDPLRKARTAHTRAPRRTCRNALAVPSPWDQRGPMAANASPPTSNMEKLGSSGRGFRQGVVTLDMPPRPPNGGLARWPHAKRAARPEDINAVCVARTAAPRGHDRPELRRPPAGGDPPDHGDGDPVDAGGFNPLGARGRTTGIDM